MTFPHIDIIVLCSYSLFIIFLCFHLYNCSPLSLLVTLMECTNDLYGYYVQHKERLTSLSGRSL